MRLFRVAVACSLLLIGNHAMAQTCSEATPSSKLSASAIRSIVVGNYVCVGSYPNAAWNELHAGGILIDYKKGPKDPVDPSIMVGTYTIAPSAEGGVITYTYNSGSGTYSYHMQPAGGDRYRFCPADGSSQAVTAAIRQSHC